MIAYEHCKADSAKNMDWSTIVMLYDKIARKKLSPVTALSRAIAIGQVQGAEEGLRALDKIPGSDRLESYLFLWAAHGDFHFTLGDFEVVKKYFRKGLRCARSKSGRRYSEGRLECGLVELNSIH